MSWDKATLVKRNSPASNNIHRLEKSLALAFPNEMPVDFSKTCPAGPTRRKQVISTDIACPKLKSLDSTAQSRMRWQDDRTCSKPLSDPRFCSSHTSYILHPTSYVLHPTSCRIAPRGDESGNRKMLPRMYDSTEDSRTRALAV